MAAIGQKQAGADDNILPAADSDFRGRHILLVDDVVTTGATLTACADELTAAGAERISVLALAVTGHIEKV